MNEQRHMKKIHSSREFVHPKSFDPAWRRFRPTLVGLFLAIVVGTVSEISSFQLNAQDESAEPETVALTLDPSAPSWTPLKHALTHHTLALKEGNAALAYQAIFLQMGEAFGEDLKQASDWNRLPSDEFPLQKAETILAKHAALLERIKKASLYQDCDWQIPIREEGFTVLLPHLSHLRKMTRLLALQIRRDIVSADSDSALDGIRSGLAIAQHTADGPTLIEGLVAVAIGNVMLDQIETFVRSPGAPNLYWPLTALTRPFFSLREAMDLELSGLLVMMPELARSPTEDYTSQDWVGLINNTLGFMQPSLSEKNRGALAAFGFGVMTYPHAKQDLIASGRTVSEVENMPVAHALVQHTVDTVQYHYDSISKWLTLPYWESHEGLSRTMRELIDKPRDSWLDTVVRAVLPATARAHQRFALTQQRIELMRVFEAVRAYAATHDGRGPTSLDEIEEMPLPINPITGKAFDYSYTHPKATLQVTTEISRGRADIKRYEITLRQK